MRALMNVKITKCTGEHWYKGRIGQKFDIYEKRIFEGNEVYITTGLRYLKVEDVVITEEYPTPNNICRICGYNEDLYGTKKCSYCNTEY